MELNNKINAQNKESEINNNVEIFIHQNGYTWDEKLEFAEIPSQDIAEYLEKYCKALIKRANIYKEDERYDFAKTKITLKLNDTVFSSDNEADFLNALAKLSEAPFTLDVWFDGHAHNTITRFMKENEDDEIYDIETTADDFGWEGFALYPYLERKKNDCNFKYMLVFEAHIDGSISTCEIKNGVAKGGEEIFTQDVVLEDFSGEFAYKNGAASVDIYPAEIPEFDKSIENLITKYLSDEELKNLNDYLILEDVESAYIEIFPDFKDIKQAREFVSEFNSSIKSVAEYNPQLRCYNDIIWFNKENFSILRMTADKEKFYLLGAKL